MRLKHVDNYTLLILVTTWMIDNYKTFVNRKSCQNITIYLKNNARLNFILEYVNYD